MSKQKLYQAQFGPGFTPLDAGASATFLPQRRENWAFARYDFAVDGGAVGLITPVTNTLIPANAIILESIINVITTTVGSTGNVSVGLSAGAGGAAALLAATARASLSAGSLFQGIPVQQASGANTSLIKMSAAGRITVTVATNALTAGVMEIWARYFIASA